MTVKKRIIYELFQKKGYNSHTEPLFKTLKILQFPQLCEFFKLQFMQRFVQNFLPISFENTWITNRIRRGDQAQVELRDDHLLHVPRARNLQLSLLPLVSFPQLWESFPADNIKFLRNKSEFNLELKKYFLEKLSSIPICTRLLCPTCHLT